MFRVWPPKFPVIAITIWVVLIALSDYNPLKKYQMSHELSELEAQKAFMEKEIVRVHKERQEITESDASLETFAREKYMMKKDNEEVFVLVDEEGNPVE
ncbi:septum formation initiator family protein [Siphonobacter sp. SORGH_AS_1065]|uniref:FtsB family cell division protein n=1 Tax=Siphonobacter sp. SORGH_AS_1065 TaxID=3041795 RepID=UPI002780BD88|nr:septum formation initiator family protein [Siphonobacter sp. SORGH_AS_1065]MDQ1086882.1 cell division protein DivIC [Siphonobacter sp. SORGH_AS_1065]